MLDHILQKVFRKTSQTAPPLGLLQGHGCVTSVRHAALDTLQDRRMERSHSPPEMHAIDHLARRHTKAFF
jgi:hypothetical protein